MALTPSPPDGGPRRRLGPPSTLDLYVYLVCLVGLPLLGSVLVLAPWPSLDDRLLPSIAFLVVAAVLGEARPLPIAREDEPNETISTSAPFVIALIAVGGLAVALAAQSIASLVDDALNRRALKKSLFNTAQYAISVAVGRGVYCLLSGEQFLSGPESIDETELLALLAGGVAMIATNRLLVAIVISIAVTLPVNRILREDGAFILATHAVLLSIGGVAADVADDGVGVLLLLSAPVIAVYFTTAAAMRHAHEANHDSLTGLTNRDRLQRNLRKVLDTREDNAVHVVQGPGFILVDLDHFKDINDTLGHPVGDQLLRQVADRLQGAVPGELEVSRLGGDEFAVVVEGDLEATLAVAHSLLASLERPMRIGDLELLVRASAGVAVAPAHGTDPETLMKNADIALYHAKLERDRISAYAAEFDVNTVDRLQLLADLRTALDTDQLAVAYQPQVDLATGCTVGVEALIRWNHPSRGLVPPDDFIPLAENSGLIGELTTYVLDTALSSLAHWRARGHDILLAVNLSARHLSDLALPRSVREALARHDIPAAALILEVTETGILSDPARVDAVIAALRETGVAIAVDDYGTGHASLNYLKQLEIDELKVDRSFVSDMGNDHHDFVIVRSTIALARDLGLRVVAEGIEDESTAHALRDMGCHVGQGYHLGRPTTPQAVLERLEGERAVPAIPSARSAPD